jgi:hypothetical protein
MKLIPLTRGKVAKIDDDDFDRVSQYKWHANFNSSTRIYACHSLKKLRMHRLIMDAPQDLFVDHINGDTLDNRKANLRLVTHLQNCHNLQNPRISKERAEIHSKYRCVYWDGKAKWCAYIGYKSKKLQLGCFRDEDDAALMYDVAAQILFGHPCFLNFPH